MIFNDITITSLDTITAYGMDGTYRFTLDELQNAKIANTQDKTDITGKGGRKLNSLKKNKAVVVSGTSGLISGGLMEVQTGGKFESKDANVKWKEYITVAKDATTATTTYKATGTEGNEIEKIYIKDANGVVEKTLTQVAATPTKDASFTYTPDSKTITFAAGQFDAEAEIVVSYFRKVSAYTLDNLSDNYSEKCQLYIDCTGEDICSNIYHVQAYIPRADFSGNFDFDLGGDQTVHAFEADSLAGSCGLGGNLWSWTVFGANAEDAA